MPRYQVWGMYDDPHQITCDVVDADTPEQAEAIIKEARGGEDSEYIFESASDIADEIEFLKDLLLRPAEDIQRDIRELAEHYKED